MGNILDYLAWRQDLSFHERPFNEVDNLLLSTLSYFDFRDIVSDEEILLKEAYVRYKVLNHQINGLFLTITDEILEKMAHSIRFGNIYLSHYVDIIDESQTVQFSAIKIRIHQNTYFISFRGTDDTLVGWKEDFSMTYQIVPAQKMAHEYLEKNMNEEGTYFIGGHSKGGNLAVYASMMIAPHLQEKIQTIYSNDGPGICFDFIEKEKYEKIKNRIMKFVPSYDIVGMLFEKEENVIIIQSNQKGILQHNITSWQVNCFEIIKKENFEKESQKACIILDEWLQNMSMAERKQNVDDFFEGFFKNNYKTLKDVASKGADGFITLVQSLAKTTKSRREIINYIAKDSIEEIKNTLNIK